MTVPDYETFMRPLLELLADGETRAVRDIRDALSDRFKLTDADRTELLASGKQTVVASRVGWANTYLTQAGLIERPSRGHATITDAGLKLLAEHPGKINSKTLESFTSFQDFLRRSSEHAASTAIVPALASGEELTAGPSVADGRALQNPQETVDLAVAQNRAAVEGELLRRSLMVDSTGFERLVLNLLEQLGYGRAGKIEHTGGPHDGGIDGLISQDPLGLDRIYVQAKQYGSGTVERPDIQRFVGSLVSHQGDRGVFITTSTFTREARDESAKVPQRIELIDGRELARLMVRHGVGVREDSRAVLYGIDDDFFDSL